ncbi:hypothetical protein BFJ63_vAg11831 [Fusarium oxysporum f. sp. narcissi]|uniref:Uncharacterized protein n=3 Tax=Fusarium oxysporum TaxID=5507 RepID=A0A420MD82_FUSOX|nr:hypothetical protein BFJ65_g16938 [Fusarium oxysporum f. sp. cepae]RKK66028.1 hypothetical protein BFJ69_g15773 [Fusarium oxysporum]RYC85305.1 hypothetical protein BFJ63_vAg11831 [Fusarium oxysporum f. sp. narcissi]RKK24005.1 hypothetical protein BFJ67_g16855 [Fusarium oxysporum f. sp. cepae]RKK26890.1 hypothetical protein BFJ66_g16909 [Fusarium oxysporum f. sp. cepae]
MKAISAFRAAFFVTLAQDCSFNGFCQFSWTTGLCLKFAGAYFRLLG